MLNIVYMGTPDFAVPTLTALSKSNHSISAVVTAPDKPAGRGRKLTASAVKIASENLGIDLFQPISLNEKNFIEQMKRLNPDIFIIVAFRKLPKILFEIPPLGAINLHASLLPKYRGAAPIHHALMNGDNYTGVTTFRINNKIDTGNILLQKKVIIHPEDTLGELWKKLSIVGADAVVETVDQIETGSIHFRKQDESKISTAPKITAKDCKIDWNNSAENIHNQIRALSPKPGAYTLLNENRIKLFESKVEDEFKSNNNLIPGFMSNTKTKLIFMTGNGILSVSRVQPEGKKRMDVSSFLSGNKISKEVFNAN